MVKDKSIFLYSKRSQTCANHIVICGLVITIRNSICVINEARKGN